MIRSQTGMGPREHCSQSGLAACRPSLVWLACDRPRSPQGPSCCCVAASAVSTCFVAPLLLYETTKHACIPAYLQTNTNVPYFTIRACHAQAGASARCHTAPVPACTCPQHNRASGQAPLPSARSRHPCYAFSPCHGRTIASLPAHIARTPSHKQPLGLASNIQ